MLNPATIVQKLDNVLANIEAFNTSLIASIQAVEAVLGPGAASANLALVAASVEAFTGQIGLAKQLVDTNATAFGAVVTAFQNILKAAKNLTANPTAAPAAAAH